MRALGLLAALALAVVVAACGGAAREPGQAGAALAPADARAVVELDGDLESSQWRAARELVERFPDGDRLLTKLRELEPAAGDRIVVVALGDGAWVGLTQPEDESSLRTLLEEHDLVSRDVAGWTAVAKEAAVLDRYEQALARGTLEGDDRYEAATGAFGGDALLTAYARGEGAFEWAGVALTVEEDGVRLTGRLRAGSALPAAVPDGLVEEAPADALAVLAFGGGPFLSQLPSIPGLDLAPIAGLLEGGGIVWVRPGLPIPEVTALLPDGDPAVVDRLVRTLAGGEPEPATLDGRPAKRVRAGAATITYAELDGRLVVTTAAGLDAGAGRLTDDAEFREAREAAGMPDRTNGFLYVNLRRVVPLLGLTGAVDDELSRYLDPFASVLGYVAGDGAEGELGLFVAIR